MATPLLESDLTENPNKGEYRAKIKIVLKVIMIFQIPNVNLETFPTQSANTVLGTVAVCSYIQ